MWIVIDLQGVFLIPMQLLALYCRTGIRELVCPPLPTCTLHISFLTYSGHIMFYTHPPEQHTLPTHISADIVKEWGQAFDLVSEREGEGREGLGGIREMGKEMR